MIGAVVLAAGSARRYGAPKLALPIQGVPLVRRVVQAALDACAQVIVVTGAQHQAIEELLHDLPATLAPNADWALGIGQSLAFGIARLRACEPRCSGALIALADQARVGADEFRQLATAHAAAPKRIIAAQYDDALGAPCLFPATHFDALMQLSGDAGARTIVQEHAANVIAIPMPQAAFDIDTPSDYARMRE